MSAGGRMTLDEAWRHYQHAAEACVDAEARVEREEWPELYRWLARTTLREAEAVLLLLVVEATQRQGALNGAIERARSERRAG